MAIRTLDPRSTRSLPAIRGGVVAPAGRRDNVVLPAIGFLILVAAVAIPVVRGAVASSPPVAVQSRLLSVPAAQISTLDAIAPMPVFVRPRSSTPVGGFAFVRCTHLWFALPDGSQAHRLLAMPGLSSPAFAPDGRTIAFLADGQNGQQLWLTASDGSRSEMVGSVTSHSRPLSAKATALSWSADGDTLAFALVSPGDDPWTNKSAIWTLELGSGEFTRRGVGWPAPFWLDNQLGDASWKGGLSDFRFLTGHLHSLNGRWGAARRLSSAEGDLSAGFATNQLWGPGADTTAILREPARSAVELAIRRGYWAGDRLVTTPPDGELIDPTRPPAVAEDGSVVAVDLLGPDGGPDLGLVDAHTGGWTVLDYAWNASFSPTPVALGPIDARRAAEAARELFGAWDRHPEAASLLLAARRVDSPAPLAHMGYTIGTPRLEPKRGWSVPTTIFGEGTDGFAFRRLSVIVHVAPDRLVAAPHAASRVLPISTIHQAVRFLETTLTANVLSPAGLPPGTRLAERPVDAYSWGGRTTGSLNLIVPPRAGHGTARSITISYGSGGFGCGPSPHPVSIAGTPGIAAAHQVAWPAGPDETSGPYGIYATLPMPTILSMAEAMEHKRRIG